MITKTIEVELTANPRKTMSKLLLQIDELINEIVAFHEEKIASEERVFHAGTILLYNKIGLYLISLGIVLSESKSPENFLRLTDLVADFILKNTSDIKEIYEKAN